MKVGRRTQAYFVGFILGVAVVSLMIDIRRSGMEKAVPPTPWEWRHASVEDLPEAIRNRFQPSGMVTAASRHGTASDSETPSAAVAGWYFAAQDGTRYWWYGQEGSEQLYEGEVLEVLGHAGIDATLMQTGFEHQGNPVISDLADAPTYRVSVQVSTAMEWVLARENLLAKHLYIADVRWIPLSVE